MSSRASTVALALACAAALLVLAPRAAAHPITVDGAASEWTSRAPTAANLGLVARDASNRGTYVWLDATGDTRTDLATPEAEADITRVQYTATTAGLGILVRLAATTSSTPPVQVQVAIDTDRVAGGGQNFLAGFADTRVAEDARWERLVQTLFGSGGTARVLNTSFAPVATVAAARGADGVEVFVPWSALGLSGPPATPLRFTVATFRAQPSDDTVDVGGSASSNALDAVTEYAEPRATAHPNTFEEVMDGVVDYYADVYFNADGEAYAPLLVTRFVANATATAGNEWVAVRNMTAGTLPLRNYKLGDEETVDAGEGMYTFPPDATLAAGATYIVAVNGADYATRFSRPPDAEFGGATDAPDMTRYSRWATGSVALSNTEDEVLVVDPSNTIVDVVVYGTAAYAGVAPRAVIATAGSVYNRIVGHPDRDDGAMDFADGGVACATNADCGGGGACGGCTLNVCEPRPMGAMCSDGNVCNGLEACDGAGACAPGTPLTCTDENPCTLNRCDPTAGCAADTVPPGTPCADENRCNGDETCNAAGACVPGAPRSCDDSNPCTADTCSPTAGCANAPVAPGTACSDGNACNGAETCTAAGACVAGAAPTCDDGNPCTADRCDPAAGCVAPPVEDGVACGGDPCSGPRTCRAGACVSSAGTDCDDRNPCTTDLCNPTTGCDHFPSPPGTACSDGNACNGTETCTAAGACVAGTAPMCDDGNPCTVDRCDPMTGCARANAPAGAPCADENRCNGDETCNAAGACVPGTAPTCDDGNPCTADGCNPATGCVRPPAPEGTPCPDTNLCNGGETCNAAGACVPGAAVSCPPPAARCLVAACNPTTGACATANAPPGTLCDDGDVCNGVERCDGMGSCAPGTPTMVCVDAGPDAADADDAADATDDAADATDGAADDATTAPDVVTVDDTGATPDTTVATDTAAGEDTGAADDAGAADATADDAPPPDDATDAALADTAVTEDVTADATTDAARDAADAATTDARADAGADAGADAALDAATTPPPDESGCGCAVPGADARGRGLASAVALALGVLLARRRRR